MHAFTIIGPTTEVRQRVLDRLLLDRGLWGRNVQWFTIRSHQLESHRLPSISIDDVRPLSLWVSLKGPERKAVIIHDAHTLTKESQHALLKTLEEPETSCDFFLLSESEASLLATIRSRCRIIRFSGAILVSDNQSKKPLEVNPSTRRPEGRSLLRVDTERRLIQVSEVEPGAVERVNQFTDWIQNPKSRAGEKFVSLYQILSACVGKRLELGRGSLSQEDAVLFITKMIEATRTISDQKIVAEDELHRLGRILLAATRAHEQLLLHINPSLVLQQFALDIPSTG